MPILLFLLVLAASKPMDPVGFGLAQLAPVAGSRIARVQVRVTGRGPAESFAVKAAGRETIVTAADRNGAMYGLTELSERIKMRGAAAWRESFSGTPYLRDRGMNLFLTLPWDYVKSDTDYDRAALTDPDRWYFHNDGYWTTLFDLMARARLNWLDIHGTWDVSATNAPNLYAYFIQSDTYPEVGVAPAIKAANLRQLNRVIGMAHARGIRVSLMAYQATLGIPQNPRPPYRATEALLYDYTREVVEKMIRQAPGLDAIGFRIGESGRSESFYNCYIEAVKRSGRRIPLYTRSWLTHKQNVLPLARAFPNFSVEIKYNGEQWGPPYPVEGGRMANWHSYSYEDYLSDSGAAPAAHLWQGNPAPENGRTGEGENGRKGDNGFNPRVPAPAANAQRPTHNASSRWPDEPYKIVWQVRANGTHRIFPFYEPHWVRNSIRQMKIGTASGYTAEGLNAYYPASPRYYLANPADQYCDWVHERDEMYWLLWGRLGYDPDTPEAVFRARIDEWFGSQGGRIASLWKTASRIVPLAFTAFSLGPDHRNHAPELEWGGTTQDFIEAEPFDSLTFRGIREELADRATGAVDGRPGLASIADQLALCCSGLAVGAESTRIEDAPPANRKRLKELTIAMHQLANLGRYYQNRFLGAWQAALAEAPGATLASPGDRLRYADQALAAWRDLAESAESQFYRPFTDRLRMGVNGYHWKQLLSRVQAETAAAGHIRQVEVNPVGLASVSATTRLAWRSVGNYVECSIPAAGLERAWLLVKPLPSQCFWHKIPMRLEGAGRRATEVAATTAGSVPADTYGRRRGPGYRASELAARHGEVSLRTLTAHAPPQTGKADLAMLSQRLAGAGSPWSGRRGVAGGLGRRVAARFVIRIPRENWGHCIAAEVEAHGLLARIPSLLNDGETPYLVVPARSGPTPRLYGSEEAMTYLDPATLKPEKHGVLLLAARAWAFHRGFRPSVQRKLLDPVSRGMTLLVLYQDYASGRYPLDWLPGPPRVVAKAQEEFDPAGALGLEPVRTRDILYQAFVPGNGWEVLGNGGIAHRKVGKGDIWMVQARLQPRMHVPPCGEDLLTLLRMGHGKPVVLIDSGTEGADKSSAVIPDFMNAHGIPFLTLGEVIAREEGMNSQEPIAGNLKDDDVLEGRGKAMVRAFLEAKVKAKAAVPTAPSKEAFERLRVTRKAEMLRCLGLSPMPPRTPLNARVTGVTQRKGYRVENIVLESRPRFYVTAQAYVPDGTVGTRYPVIINPIGHWQHKKAEPVVQSRCIFQALRGYLAVVVDSPGHSFEGDTKIERRAEGDHNDFKLVQGGTNATGYYVWDLIRVLDYVATRPDSDMKHVGLTGASGGGLATLYAFAVDDRYTCAVPVVYVSSMELAPDNGCLCNHVPAMLQVGDRADVLAIQAPKPVLIIGAQEDVEFPPNAMRLTGEKVKRTWALFGAAGDTNTLIFPGGHDYGKGMREAAQGFWDKYLKGIGDGSPVAEPEFATADPASPEMFVRVTPPADERTMRELSLERLRNPKNVSWEEVVRVNGGLPVRVALHYREIGAGPKRYVTFDSESGLTIPGVLFLPAGTPTGVKVLVSESGKVAAIEQFHVAQETDHGFACLCLDVRGFGELAGIDQRLMTYLGTAIPFAQAWDITRAAEAMRKYSDHVEVIASGPTASLAALYAGLMDRNLSRVVGSDCLREYSDVFDGKIGDMAVQPRADLNGSLTHLRSLVPHGEWHFRGE